jgi:hypothetical protein
MINMQQNAAVDARLCQGITRAISAADRSLLLLLPPPHPVHDQACLALQLALQRNALHLKYQERMLQSCLQAAAAAAVATACSCLPPPRKKQQQLDLQCIAYSLAYWITLQVVVGHI